MEASWSLGGQIIEKKLTPSCAAHTEAKGSNQSSCTNSWLDDLYRQEPATLNRFDRQIWESLLGDHHSSNKSNNSNRNQEATTYAKVTRPFPAAVDPSRTAVVKENLSAPTKSDALSRIRFEVNSPTKDSAISVKERYKTIAAPIPVDQLTILSSPSHSSKMLRWATGILDCKSHSRSPSHAGQQPCIAQKVSTSNESKTSKYRRRMTRRRFYTCSARRSGAERKRTLFSPIGEDGGAAVDGLAPRELATNREDLVTSSKANPAATNCTTSSASSSTSSCTNCTNCYCTAESYHLVCCPRSSLTRSSSGNYLSCNSSIPQEQKSPQRSWGSAVLAKFVDNTPDSLTPSKYQRISASGKSKESQAHLQHSISSTGDSVSQSITSEMTMEFSDDSWDELNFDTTVQMTRQAETSSELSNMQSMIRTNSNIAIEGLPTSHYENQRSLASGLPVSAKPTRGFDPRFSARTNQSEESCNAPESCSSCIGLVDAPSRLVTNPIMAPTDNRQLTLSRCTNLQRCFGEETGGSAWEAYNYNKVAELANENSTTRIPISRVSMHRTRKYEEPQSAAAHDYHGAMRSHDFKCNTNNKLLCDSKSCLQHNIGCQQNRSHALPQVAAAIHPTVNSSSENSGWTCIFDKSSSKAVNSSRAPSTDTCYTALSKPQELSPNKSEQTAGAKWINPRPALLAFGPLISQESMKQPRLHTSHAFLCYKPCVSCEAPICVSTRIHQELGLVASRRLCSADHSQFAWISAQPTWCNRTCGQLLPVPLVNSQTIESPVLLSSSPVFHDVFSTNLLAINVLENQRSSCSFRVATPEVMATLHFVLPTEDPNAMMLNSSDNLNHLSDQQHDLTQTKLANDRSESPHESLLSLTGSYTDSERSITETSSSSTFHDSKVSDHRGVSKVQQHRQLCRLFRTKMQQNVQEKESISVHPSSLSLSNTETSTGMTPTSLEKQLNGLLESLRHCRQATASVAASSLNQQSQAKSSGIIDVVEQMVLESKSQQAALNDLISALKGIESRWQTSEHELKHSLSPSAQTNATSPGTFLSEQFYSVASAVPDDTVDARSRASGLSRRSTGSANPLFASPSIENEPCWAQDCRHLALWKNNNADDSAKLESVQLASVKPLASQGRRPRTHYARRLMVRLEECTAVLVQETACRDNPVTSVCFVHQDPSDEDMWNFHSAAVQATLIAQQQSLQERLREVERRTLALAWRKPPVSYNLLRQLDPTVSSFIWWSLIPLHWRLPLLDKPASVSTALSAKPPQSGLPCSTELEFCSPMMPLSHSHLDDRP